MNSAISIAANPSGLFNVEPSRGSSGRLYWLLVIAIFSVAAGLRCSLAWVNRQANDNHYEVIQLLLNGRTGLKMTDCHECFHPKLFYHICAWTIRGLGLKSAEAGIIAGQLLNAGAGILTLIFVGAALHAVPCAMAWRLWTFALVALNPRLIAINGQLSNDSLAILFSTAALFTARQLLRQPSIWFAVATQVCLSLALLTKGTAWVAALAILIGFLVRTVITSQASHRALFFLLSTLTIANGFGSIQWAGYDFEHYDAYANMGRDQPLHFLENTSVGRPGVRSIAEGYLSFPWLSLLADPQITNGMAVEQVHRTSVWAQLYARANFAQFEQHPHSWITHSPTVLNIGRASFVCGLLPLVCVLVGLARATGQRFQAWRTLGDLMNKPGIDLVTWLCACGYIAFIIKFTMDYRDFSSIKFIYMLPGVFPLSLVVVEGLTAIAGGRSANRKDAPAEGAAEPDSKFTAESVAKYMVHGILAVLITLHAAGIIALVQQLAGADYE